MKSHHPIRLIIFSFFVFLAASQTSEAAMTDYCLVPPYVVQNVQPNVMVIVDNSGSMFNFAYFDGFTSPGGSDNMCANSSSPCTGFLTPGAYPTFKFYGYFDPDYWYTYDSRFVRSDPKTGSGLAGERAKLSTEWDGNFLNWLTMRRVDILRKVLTGGKKDNGDGTDWDRLRGEVADGEDRGIYKRIANAELYTPFNSTRKFIFETGSSGTSSFDVRNTADSDTVGSFDVAVRVPATAENPVAGILQDVITKVRLGLMFYNGGSDYDGGFVQVSIAAGNLSSIVNQVNGKRPNSNTPLAETLWSATGYFAQVSSLLGGHGPRYHSGDYSINNNNDPFNFGTGGSPRYPACSKNFVLFITDGEPCADGDLPSTLVNFAGGTGHVSPFNCSNSSCPAKSGTSPEVYTFPSSTLPSCFADGNVAGFEDVALYAHTTDLRSSTLGKNDISGKQALTIYPVFAFGKNSTLLKYTAINGGFEDSNANNIPDIQTEWDKNSDGQPDTYYEAYEGQELETSIKAAFSNMITRVASGTAASVLASGEGTGSILIQASFYPRRRFGDDVIQWVGGLQNLWYHLDPQYTKSNIREDTIQETPDRKLHLKNDYIMKFYFDTNTQTTKAARFQDVNGDSSVLTAKSTLLFEQIKNIWDSGKLLWSRDIINSSRSIYTTINGSTLQTFTASDADAAVVAPYLQLTDVDASGSTMDEAKRLISWIRGTDDNQDLNSDGIADFRPRTVTVGSTTNVWRLGDILNSTPKITSSGRLNHYFDFPAYNDLSYFDFSQTTAHLNRGVVYVGANDGMLHAFDLGKLETSWSGQADFEKARIAGTDPSSFPGKELWAFIPKNVLPYLNYIADSDYCHIYTVDLTPFVFDASINKPTGCTEANYWDCDKLLASWRTIVIGGMRFGGGCRNLGSTCTDVDNDGDKDCVNTPVDGLGYSSYFALDVTDVNNPQLLWEFTNPELGFATSGPAVVRISAKDSVTGFANNTKNGRWYVVFGSGPTGPIDTDNHQFMGRSDQNLKFFILDLKTGSLLRTLDSEITHAFSGSLFYSPHDINWPVPDTSYQDDVIYVPYVNRTETSPYTWTGGGIGRIWTKENLDPTQWTWQKIMEGIGPVTASIQKMDNIQTGNMWLFFGTGRYFYSLGDSSGSITLDDKTSQRTLFGIKDPCVVMESTSNFIVDPDCTDMVDFGTLTNVTSIGNVPSSSTADGELFKGWYINLDATGNYTYAPDPSRTYGAERVITDPLAVTNGLVYFTTFKPYTDECSLGGKSFIWGVQYNTGGAGTASQLKGKALMQVSTGSIEQVDLSTQMTGAGGRKSIAIEGEPPAGQGLSVLVSPPPGKRVLHIKQR